MISNNATYVNKTTPMPPIKNTLASIIIVQNIYVYNWVDDNWVVGNYAGNDFAPNGILNTNIANCPVTIQFPGVYEDESGRKGETTIVDNRAFTYCANSPTGKTKHVVLPKEVKIIRQFGFDRAYDLESFTIEEGSNLEEIGQFGISFIGDERDNTQKQFNLILPYTLKVVEQGGIRISPRIKKLFYCGFFVLNEDLLIGDKTEVLVTKRYSYRQIFQNNVDDIDETLYDEAEEACQGRTPPDKYCTTLQTLQTKLLIPLFIVDI